MDRKFEPLTESERQWIAEQHDRFLAFHLAAVMPRVIRSPYYIDEAGSNRRLILERSDA